MALKLVGKKAYDYTNEKVDRYTGIKVHCVQEHASPLEGYLVETISVSSTKPIFSQANEFPFGTVFTPVYDRYGKIQDMILKSLPEDKTSEKK